METLRRTLMPDVRPSRKALVSWAALLTFLVLLVCLIPKPENDLFFILRIGGDILHSHRLPRADTYSWTRRGAHWDLPEWLAFVLYFLAFRCGGFLGTWALMSVLAVAAVGIVWLRLVRRVGAAGAFALAALMLLAMSDFLQERPYAFTYPLLAVGMILLVRLREGRLGALPALVALCALWTNLHQGVVVLLGLTLAYSLGDAATALWLRREEARGAPPDLLAPGWEQEVERRAVWRRHAWSSWRMLGTALACGSAAMLSPYGWRVFWNVWVTLRDPALMASVTEWNPVTIVPATQIPPFLLVALVAFGSLGFSARRNLADVVALAALFGEALLHARNIPLFAIGTMVVGAPHLACGMDELRDRLGLRAGIGKRRGMLAGFVALAVGLIVIVSVLNLRRAIGPRGWSLEGIGEAVARVPRYPAEACAFVNAQDFPPGLRLLNNFEIGGYLMWRLPREPVFIDGRLDVYAGRTFDDMLILAKGRRTPPWEALVEKYDFDCVLTTSAREARPFLADPRWQLVYEDPATLSGPRCRVLLRRRPAFAVLIARCLRSFPESGAFADRAPRPAADEVRQ